MSDEKRRRLDADFVVGGRSGVQIIEGTMIASRVVRRKSVTGRGREWFT